MVRQPAPEILRRALVRHRFTAVADGALLDQYGKQSDQDAFAELVRRYAGLVWSVCRRTCSDDHLAEDAFQATFIALARQAKSIRRAECLPAWLHGVARRHATKVRVSAARRTASPLVDVPSTSISPEDQVGGREVMNVVEAEIERLPEQYRSALLLCWFEDDSLDEAATRLGISKGTLWGRLKRGRDLLRNRLEKRGLGLPAAFGGMVLVSGSAPAGLTTRTVEHVLREAANSVVSGVREAGSWSLMFAKAGGGVAVAAAVLIGIVTLLPASNPSAPAKKDAEPIAKVATIDDGFPLPPSAIHRFGNRQLRHPEGISTSAASPDGKLLATASGLAIVIWDLKTLSAKRVWTEIPFNIHGHDDRGGKLAFLPDSKSILVGLRPRPPNQAGLSMDHAQVWDIETGKMKFALNGVSSYQNSVWLTADGKEIALSSQDPNGSAIRFFSATDGKELRSVKLPESVAYSSVAAAGKTIAYIGAAEVGVTVLDATTGKELHRIAESRFSRFTLSHDGKILAAVDKEGKVRIHDVAGKKELFTFNHPEKDRPGPMTISEDGSTLYFTSNHGRLFRWDLKENKPGKDFGNRHNFWNLSGIVLNEKESMLISTSLDHLIKRWDLKTGDEIKPPVGYTTRTTSTMSADGKHVIISDHEGQIDFWELATGRMVNQLQPSHLGGINCLAQSPDGRWLAAGRTSQDIRLFDLSTGKMVRDMYLGDNSDSKWNDQVHRVAFNGDSSIVFCSSEKTGVTAWDVASGNKLWNNSDAVPLQALDPKGRWIAVGGSREEQRNIWKLLNAKTGEEISRTEIEPTGQAQQQPRGLYPPITSDLVFSPDGSRLLTTHYDGFTREWDTETRRLVRTFKTHTSQGAAYIACSQDGKWLSVGTWDHAVKLFELATGKQILALPGHQSGITQVAFTNDGRGIISHADLSPVLWSLTPDQLPAVDGTAWETLASEDGAKAYRMLWALAKKPEVAIKLFQERIKPTDLTIERKQFETWQAALDHPQFRIREQNEKELMNASIRVPITWLRKALADSKTDEQRTRLTRVLAAREKLADPNDWRLRRAVTILELAGTPEAKELLRAWAKATPDSPLFDEAKAALSRLH